LGAAVRDVAGLLRTFANSKEGEVDPEMAARQIWLEPKDRDDVATVQRLVELARISQNLQGGAAPSREESHITYKFSAAINSKGAGGWLGAAEGEAVAELEERVKAIAKVVGRSTSDDDGGESLSGISARLHQRLDNLERVRDESSCDQLRAVVRLFAAEVDVAISEATRLGAQEAEDLTDDVLGVDTLPKEISQLHDKVSGLSGIFERIADLEEQLARQEEQRGQLARFASDLAGAEASVQQATNLLRAATQAAVQMKASAENTRKQMERNVAALEKKLNAKGMS